MEALLFVEEQTFGRVAVVDAGLISEVQPFEPELSDGHAVVAVSGQTAEDSPLSSEHSTSLDWGDHHLNCAFAQPYSFEPYCLFERCYSVSPYSLSQYCSFEPCLL